MLKNERWYIKFAIYLYYTKLLKDLCYPEAPEGHILFVF